MQQQTSSEGYTFEIRSIPDGREGVIATLKIMRRIVREYKRDPALLFLARDLTRGVTAKDWIAEIRTIFDFVRGTIRYTLDPNEIETLFTPDKLLQHGSGDCDDMATLLATLLESAGHPTRFCAVGERAGDLTHVYVETRVGDTWISLDPTESHDIGWYPGGMRDCYRVHN